MKTDSEIVALSALMTTSMLAMPKVIEMIKARNPEAMIMVGGAPISQEVADNYGADGYAKNAANAVQEAIQMVSRLREMGKA
jgi:dimethylamine corrinoid protein